MWHGDIRSRERQGSTLLLLPVCYGENGGDSMKIKRTRYTWNDLSWRETKAGVFTSHISLFPAEYLEVEPGWEIHGPMRVRFAWEPEKQHTRARYKPLRRKEFDMDNPLEYPCGSCGSGRKTPCQGDDPACAFRVFFVGGGLL